MTLLADICRCHSTTCPQRETCARWTQRKTGRVHADLFHYDQPDCPAYIQEEGK